MPADYVEPWFMGLTSDHIYEHCPCRERSREELERVGWWKQGLGALQVDSEFPFDVCGWCRRVWKARNR